MSRNFYIEDINKENIRVTKCPNLITTCVPFKKQESNEIAIWWKIALL